MFGHINLKVYLFRLIIVICCFCFAFSSDTIKCTTSKKTLDCSGQNLSDCPPVQRSIKHLILDNNRLESFSSDNCLNWTHLISLSVRRNQLTTVPDFYAFKSLSTLNLDNNKLTNVTISSETVTNVVLSYNELKRLSLANSEQLEMLNVSHNRLNKDYSNDMIRSLHSCPRISVLDISYNVIDYLPISLMTFTPIKDSLISFAFNNLSEIDFGHFTDRYSKMDFSHNQIHTITVNEKNSVEFLNVSNNKLFKITVQNLAKFVKLKSIDLSNNPLNCQCNESADFMDWVWQHKSMIANSDRTICERPHKTLLVNISCLRPTTTLTPSTSFSSVTDKSMTSSSIPVTSKHQSTFTPQVDNHSWKIAIIVLVSVTVLAGVGLIIACKFRPQRRYQMLGSPERSRSIWDRLCPRFLTMRRSYGANVNSVSHITDGCFTESLMVFCSSSNTGWVQREITSVLPINSVIIDSKCQFFPLTDFILIVVNGNNCLKDSTLVHNFQRVLETKEESEIRLLILKMPNFQVLLKKNCLSDFIRKGISDKSYFSFESDPSTCLENLRNWLNLTV